MTCVNPSSNYPCPLCHAAAQAHLDECPERSSWHITIAEAAAETVVEETTYRTPRERAEHLQTVHGWRVP
jgi:hypothetical protein